MKRSAAGSEATTSKCPVVAATALAALLLAGCNAGSSDDRAATEADYEAVDVQAEEGADAAGESSDGSGLAGDGEAASNREVITNAYAAVEVDDTTEAVETLISQATDAGGYVEDRSERADDDGGPTRASLTLRVPAEDLSEILDSLEELGDVNEISESAQDITSAVRDLDARIGALETSVERLQGIMEEADNAEELLRTESSLSERQSDLESLQAERNALGDQVALSTLQVELSTEPLTEVEADGFLGGIQSGFNGVVTAANALLVLIGTVLPWVPVLAVVAAVLYMIAKRRRHKKAKPIVSTDQRQKEHCDEDAEAGSAVGKNRDNSPQDS